MSLLTSLQNDLVALSNESKKKYPDIKDSAEKLSYFLRQLKDRIPNSSPGVDIVSSELSKTLDSIRPFILACETKNPKIVPIAMGCIQRMISHRAVPDLAIQQVLKAMLDVVALNMDLQLKILQTVLPLLTSYPRIHGDMLVELLFLCFKLYESKSPIVSNTAAATLRQIVVHLFEHIPSKTDDGENSESNQYRYTCLRDALSILQDLVVVVSGDSTSFLKTCTISKDLAIELLESILGSQTSVIHEEQQLFGIIKNRLCPLIIKCLSEKPEYVIVVRLFRLIQIIIKKYNDTLITETEVFFNLYLKLVEAESIATWMKVLTFEGYKEILTDFALTRSIFLNHDVQTSNKCIGNAIHLFFRVLNGNKLRLQTVLANVDENGATTFILDNENMKIPCIEQLDKTEPPAIPDFYLTNIALRSLINLCDGFYTHILPKLTNASPQSDEDKKAIISAIEFGQDIWSNILNSLSIFLSLNCDEATHSIVIKSLEKAAIVFGLLGLSSARDAYLNVLCKSSLPVGVAADVNENPLLLGVQKINVTAILMERNVSSLKTLINVATSLISILEEKAWIPVLDTFQCAECLITNGKLEKKEREKEESPARGKFTAPNAMDNQFVGTLMLLKNFFDATIDIPAISFENLVKASCRLAKESSNNSATAINKDTKMAEDKSFAVSKLSSILIVNCGRLTKPENASLWNFVTEELIKLIHDCQITTSLRTQACSVFAELLVSAIQVTDFKQSDTSQLEILVPIQRLMVVDYILDGSAADDNIEKVIRSSWMGDIQKFGLEALQKMLQAAGQHIATGWPTIFDIIKSVLPEYRIRKYPRKMTAKSRTISELLSEIDHRMITANGELVESTLSSVKLVRLAFPIMQIVCNEFLGNLSPPILFNCIETLGAFGAQTEDLNISLTAIGLLWTVSDHLLTRKKEFKGDSEEQLSSPRSEDQDSEKPRGGKYALIDLAQPTTAITIDALWITLLTFFSVLASDLRPEVRNSASQTLFRSINLNGLKLTLDAWEECLWGILFPLFERVKNISEKPEESLVRVKTGGMKTSTNIMSHHSRNTASKQWDETKILILSGALKCFSDFLFTLDKLGGSFDKAWSLLLNYTREWIVYGSPEVTLASLKNFKTFIKGLNMSSRTDEEKERVVVLSKIAWGTWISIGKLFCAGDDGTDVSASIPILSWSSSFIPNDPTITRIKYSQEILVVYLETAAEFFNVLGTSIELSDLKYFVKTVLDILALQSSPPMTEAEAKYKIDNMNDVDQITNLQQAAFDLVNDGSRFQHIEEAPEVVLATMGVMTKLPYLVRVESLQSSLKFYTYLSLSKKCYQLIGSLFESSTSRKSLYQRDVFSHLLGCLLSPFELKYECPGETSKDPQSIWKYAASTFLILVKDGLKGLDKFAFELDAGLVDQAYSKIFKAFNLLLLHNNVPANMTKDERFNDEDFDISVLTTIETDAMKYIARPYITEDHLKQLISVYEEGSSFYYPKSNDKVASTASEKSLYAMPGFEPTCRERFTKACLQLLFTACSSTKTDHEEAQIRLSKVAAPILLKKSKSTISAFVSDRQINGKIPLSRNEEMRTVLELCVSIQSRSHLYSDINGETLQDGMETRVKAGSSALLFYIYQDIVELMAILASNYDENDRTILDLCKSALLKIGQEIMIKM